MDPPPDQIPPELWHQKGPEFVEPQADVYRLQAGRTWRREAMVSWYPSEWDDMPPPGCYFAHQLEAEGIPASRAIDIALEQSPLVILEALAGSGKTTTARALCRRRRDMKYFDCPSERSLWNRVHRVMQSSDRDTILVLDGFDDTEPNELVIDATRLTAMVTERGARAVIVTRPFAVDSIPSLAGVPRVFLRSVADPAEPGWRSWLDAWNQYTPEHTLDEDEITNRQIEDLVAVPIVHQLFAITKDLVVARYRYDDCDLLDALSCDVLETFFSSYAITQANVALLPYARMRLFGEIAWALHIKKSLSLVELTELCADAGVLLTEPDSLMNAFGHVLFQNNNRVQFRQRTFREYLTAWYWSALLSDLSHGSLDVQDVAESLGAAALARPGDRCLAFLTRLTGDWQPQEHASFIRTIVKCIAQRKGNAAFRHNLTWVLSAQNRLHDQSHWTLADTAPLREILDECRLPIALRGLSLPDADFSGLAAPRGVFVRTDLPRAQLTGANLQGASFARAQLYGSDFSHANLRGVSFRDADLSRSTLNKADLRGADLSGANLSGADVSGALYDGKTVWPERYHPRDMYTH
ncbi:MAG: pentapeptide repeat-containing protein [Proteobacteria bacterium]|nr:pentapeptide repeat-containing protein [Pseudomonadota bacterium]